ncbi:MAG TPA: amino acid adenylation domain-containing protein [Thermoanaerobaculia bacterium]|nr:amino acid adenylation domain-containing protein [Thermoanaerobaculia bacterium]
MSVAAAGKGRFFRASRERLELLRELRRDEGLESAAASIPRREDPSHRPLSFAQERLWFLDRLDPDNPAYTIPSSIRLRGRLNVPALARALTEVARRHEVLRATFHDSDGYPEQRVSPPAAVPLPLFDLRALPLDRGEDEARRVSASEAARPFRLTEGPLFRARLLRLADEEHGLAFDVHHIVADGWSLGVLVRELTTIYGGGSLPELSIQYADYAAWQREHLAGDLLEQQLAYWRERLAGSPPSLDLPMDRARPAVQTFRGGHAGRVLSPNLVDRLRSLSGSADASLFMVLLAGFQLLLARWSGQEDIPVGSPIAGRTRREVEYLIGIFLNNLVLRTDLAGDPTFRELLVRVREVAVGAYAHQDLPFEKLLAEIEPQRDLSRTPLFQVFFNLLSFPVPEIHLPGLTVEGLGAPEPLTKFDMTLYLVEEGAGLRLDLISNAALFDAPRMEEALAQYESLLAQSVADPEARIASFSLLTEAAKAVLPDPREPLDASWPGSVPEAVARHARETPDRPAVIWEGGSLTYAQLAEQMESVAAGLRTGEVVAIQGHRTGPLVPKILGALKAGAAFVILDPAYPEERNALILDMVKGIRGGGPSADDLAYIAFTSGSTGVPKGVLGLHRSLTHFYPWMRERFQLGPDDRFSLLSGLAHDPLHRDVFTPLWLGAAVAIPDPERMGEPGWLAGWMARLRVTVAHLTPAMGRLLTEPPAGSMPSLRRAFFVGDMLTRRDVERLRALAPDVEAVNLYGSTETQRAVGYHRIGEHEDRDVFPLGRGMPDVQLLVLTRAGKLAGIGEAGEVCVRSPHLAAGYLGDPALTAERFATMEGVRLYRTGDLGRYRPDGEVEPLGRADLQVKMRGFRVELGEIEAALVRHPAIREAVVVARGNLEERRLVAYLVGDASPGELRTFLRERLPEYMVPSVFVFLESLPLTPNRKVDCRALPEPEMAERAEADEILTPTEELLAGIWSEVLGTAAIGPADDFFGLGGHSLKVTQVLARVREAFRVELPVRSLFESPTLAGLAARIDEALKGQSSVMAPPLVRVARGGDFPLSFAQERLWFLQRLAPSSAAYHMPAALRLRGSLDPAALERTLHEIVRRHEALRTTFPEIDGEPRQRIQPFRPFPLPLADLRCLPQESRDTEAERIARAEAARPFDLARGPLLRSALLRLDESDWVALLGMHHIVSDGWSVGVLVRETAALYQGSALPELPVQVADFTVWQRGWLQGEALDAQVRWWREALADAPTVADLPLDRPRTVGSGPAGHVTTGLPPTRTAALRELARREGATLFMVLLAAFQALLHRLTGDDDLVVGTPIANRTHPWLEGLIGFFVNTLALRSRLDNVDPSYRDLLRSTRTTALGAYAHQDLPFEKLVEELRVERSLRHSPLFQVMLVLQNAPLAPITDLELPGLTLAPLPLAPGAAKFDLSLSFIETEAGLHAALEYDAGLFEPATAVRLLQRFEAFLEVVAADPDCRLAALPVLEDSERHQVVVERGEPAISPPALIHRRFEDWAARAPEALAIGLADRTITYGELERAANRLAHAIRAAGARLETRVAVSVERPEGWALCMLAVLKAAAVYVPLDPRLPLDRLALMLADCGASVLVTEEPLLGRLPLGEVRTVCADRVTRFGPELPPVVDIPPEALAYVIYTSGSTGMPKGVGVPHGALARQLDDAVRRLDLRPGDRLLGTHADGFDAAVEDTLSPLIAGAAIFPRGGELWSVSDLVKRIETWRITHVQIPTAYWRQVAAELDETGRLIGPPFRFLEAGGEAMPVEAARRWLKIAPGATLLNGYGPTETVVTPTSFEVTPGSRETPSGTVPIGRPRAGRAALVIDRWGGIAAHGIAGELWLGEPLARGYLGRPDATAAAFVPHPGPTIPGERLYRTGDRVRRLSDGNLEYLGRLDRQLKLRGFRIEPGEIEAALAGLPEVREAAVVVADGSRLVAFLVPRESARPAPDLLRAALRGKLPEYMVPSAFVWLEAVPLTGTGKVDRRELARRAGEEALPETGRVPPRDDLERELAEIWEDLLGVAPIGVKDDFFALGGHSLLAVRLASRIETRFGRELPIAQLFERRTVEALAQWLRPAPASSSSSPLVRIQPGGDRPPLFLVHPGGGGVLCYADLARALGPDQPLFGLQAPGLDGDRPPLDEIGQMAGLYLEAIRSVQPVGPWHLGGWSFGGLVVYEMACRIAQQGGPAGLVAILDAAPDDPRNPVEDETELLVRGLDEQFLQAVPFTADELRGLSTREQVALVLDRARRADRLPPDFDERRATGVVDVFKANLRAARSWRPRPHPGPITVFRAAESDKLGQSGTGWDALAAADVVTVPGDHLRMVAPPHVGALARALREALAAWS